MTLVHQPQFSKVMGALDIPKEPVKYDGQKSPMAPADVKKMSKPEQPKKEQPKKEAPAAAKVSFCVARGSSPEARA